MAYGSDCDAEERLCYEATRLQLNPRWAGTRSARIAGAHKNNASHFPLHQAY